MFSAPLTLSPTSLAQLQIIIEKTGSGQVRVSGCVGQEAERHTSVKCPNFGCLSALSSFPIRHSPQVASEEDYRACGLLEISTFTPPENKDRNASEMTAA